MCHFISLVVSGVDANELDAFMRKHGRRAAPLTNASLSAACRAGELQYLTTNAHCDCGTVLAQGDDAGETGSDAVQISKLARRGWSKAKIDRWIEHKQKAAERRPVQSIDSISYWAALLGDLRSSLMPTSLGVFVHDYSGDLETECFQARRRVAQREASLESALQTLQEDELLMLSD